MTKQLIKFRARFNSGLFFIFALFFFSFWAHASSIAVSVDRNPVALNESFKLTFSSSNEPDNAPDFSPLEQDFEILSRSQSSNVSIINGQYQRRVEWLLQVLAKREGRLLIPEISFGRDKSTASAVEVKKGQIAHQSISAGGDLFIEVEADPVRPMVQSQVIYRLRVYRKVSISGGNLTEPTLPDALVEQLGEDNNFETQYQGQTYVVTERKYAIFPQKSGRVTIPSIELNAELVVGQRPGFGGFFNRNITRTKRVKSKSIELDVSPIPKQFAHYHWLPAESVSLSETWSEKKLQVNVGEPLTRTITITAKGASSDQLPELNSISGKAPTDWSESIKIYPDQPVLDEQKKIDGVVSTRQEKVAVIPSKAGEYSLPKIEIPWWNTKTGKMEFAVLPQRQLTAIGANEPVTAPTAKQVDLKSAKASSSINQGASLQDFGIWHWISLLLAIGWMGTVIFFLRALKKKSENLENMRSVDVKEQLLKSKELVKKIRLACQQNDPTQAKEALMEWGKAEFKVSNLAKLAAHCGGEFGAKIMTLEKTLYGINHQNWEGKSVWQAFEQYQKQEGNSKMDSADKPLLEPLYRL